MSTESNVQVEFSKITVDHVTPHTYKSGVNQAQIRQTITRKYPSIRVNNNLQDSLASKHEFDLPTQDYTEKRVDWIIVPSSWTVKEVEEALNNNPNAIIYKYLSNKPIFTDGDLNWIDKLAEEDEDLATNFIEESKSKQLVKTSEGEIIRDKNGNEQYSRNFFAKEMPQNANQFGIIDERIVVKQPIYELKEELPRVQLHNAKQPKETVHTY